MARRERGYEQVFGIVGVGVAAEHWIGAADDVGFAVDLQMILPAITLIVGGAGAEVAVPDEASFIVVRVLPAGGFSHVTLRGMKCVWNIYSSARCSKLRPVSLGSQRLTTPSRIRRRSSFISPG